MTIQHQTHSPLISISLPEMCTGSQKTIGYFHEEALQNPPQNELYFFRREKPGKEKWIAGSLDGTPKNWCSRKAPIEKGSHVPTRTARGFRGISLELLAILAKSVCFQK